MGNQSATSALYSLEASSYFIGTNKFFCRKLFFVFRTVDDTFIWYFSDKNTEGRADPATDEARFVYDR